MNIGRVILTMRTNRGMNAREHPMARHRRVKREKDETMWYLYKYQRTYGKPALPCTVLLTRYAPSNGLDDDNLCGALKSVRDAVAAWLGVDDRHRDVVRYAYAQCKSTAWGVRIEFGPPAWAHGGLEIG